MDPNFFFALYGITVFLVPWLLVGRAFARLLMYARGKGYPSGFRFGGLTKAPGEYGLPSVAEIRALDPEYDSLYRGIERSGRNLVIAWLGGAALFVLVALALNSIGII